LLTPIKDIDGACHLWIPADFLNFWFHIARRVHIESCDSLVLRDLCGRDNSLGIGKKASAYCFLLLPLDP
jgi:hypothetical protein